MTGVQTCALPIFCEITLKLRNLKKEQFILEAAFTPSGVVRLTKLQLQGYAYIKP